MKVTLLSAFMMTSIFSCKKKNTIMAYDVHDYCEDAASDCETEDEEESGLPTIKEINETAKDSDTSSIEASSSSSNDNASSLNDSASKNNGENVNNSQNNTNISNHYSSSKNEELLTLETEKSEEEIPSSEEPKTESPANEEPKTETPANEEPKTETSSSIDPSLIKVYINAKSRSYSVLYNGSHSDIAIMVKSSSDKKKDCASLKISDTTSLDAFILTGKANGKNSYGLCAVLNNQLVNIGG